MESHNSGFDIANMSSESQVAVPNMDTQKDLKNIERPSVHEEGVDKLMETDSNANNVTETSAMQNQSAPLESHDVNLEKVVSDQIEHSVVNADTGPKTASIPTKPQEKLDISQTPLDQTKSAASFPGVSEPEIVSKSISGSMNSSCNIDNTTSEEKGSALTCSTIPIPSSFGKLPETVKENPSSTPTPVTSISTNSSLKVKESLTSKLLSTPGSITSVTALLEATEDQTTLKQEESVGAQSSPAASTTTTPSRSRPNSASSSRKTPKTKRRGSAWSDDQTEFLLEVWARYTNYRDSEEFAHNASVYRLVSRALMEKGVEKTWEQCKTRIHTLKRAYKLTKDEVNSGATSIVYCRHFEKLEIIMGDNPDITPKMLSESLAERRIKNVAHAEAIQSAGKRQQAPSDSKGGKKQKTGKKTPISPQPPPTFNQSFQNPDNPISPSAVNNYWYGQQQSSQQQQNFTTPAVYPNQNIQSSYQSTGHSASQPYYNSGNFGSPAQMPNGKQPEINNNDTTLTIKQESTDNQYYPQYQQQFAPVSTSQACKPYAVTTSVQQTKEDLEKMRLDLEMRKIDMEKNKLEMEERQRREERDHQYRMMQLLLTGLGQQNTASFLNGQGVEQEVAHAQRNTNLSRAIESGLVPGGSLTLNEKGLSFNEI